MRSLVVAVIAVWAGLLCAAAPLRAQEPRETMDEIFAAMLILLPASIDERAWADPERRAENLAALDVLVDAAENLEQHGRQRDVAFGFLASSLAVDVAELRDRYAQDRMRESRFLLRQLLETCTTCHSRLPSAQGFPLSEQLLERAELREITRANRARLEAATRQFDRALATWEGIFADPLIAPAAMDLGGYLVDYLTISLRVKRDAKRPIPVLEKLASRDDTPYYLEANLRTWVASLTELERTLAGPSGVEPARALLQQGRGMSRLPSDRRGLVQDLAASSLLHRYVDGEQEASPRLAEALYLLGLTGARTSRSYWVPESEFYLETSIRMDPTGPFASDAYAVLEELYIEGYTGSAGTDLPPDIQALLDELRGMVEGGALKRES
jgi:hypothetical protein